MTNDQNDFEIAFLDHVAIRVKDVDASVKWYQQVLGLKKYQLPEWGAFPVFLLSGRSGVAVFPAQSDDTPPDPNSKNVKIDHYAFHVTRENFEKAKRKYVALGMDFQIQDHYYFDSLYTEDPDGHIVELTSLKVEGKDFYL